VINILVVHPVTSGNNQAIYFPLGLGYIIAICEREGHEVTVLDMHNHNLGDHDLRGALRERNYDLCLMGGFAMQVAGMRNATATIKEVSPETLVVCGGVGVSDIPEIAIDYIGADAVSTGECEAIIPNLLNSIEAGRPFEGVPTFFYRREKKIIRNPKGPVVEDLDALPMPAYHHFDIDYISQRSYNGEGVRSIHMLTSRGCPFRCGFCINSILNNSKLQKDIYGVEVVERKKATQRFRSVDAIIEEINYLRETYNISDFHFADEEFITHSSRVFDVCDALRPLGITWSTSGRADWATLEKMSAMKSAGCRYVIFGVETGSQHIMDLMNKSAKKENVAKGLDAAREAGMNFIANFMIGYKGETEETIEESIDFCREQELLYFPSYVTLFPNSQIFHSGQHKITDWHHYFTRLASSDYNRKLFMNLTDLQEHELVRLRDRAIARTVGYRLLGKESHLTVAATTPILQIALNLLEIAPPKFHRLVRSIARAIFDLRPRMIKQRAPHDLGQTMGQNRIDDDGYEQSLAELERSESRH